MAEKCEIVDKPAMDEKKPTNPEAALCSAEAKPLYPSEDEDIDLDSDLESALSYNGNEVDPRRPSPRRSRLAQLCARWKLEYILTPFWTLLPSPIAAILKHPTAEAPKKDATSYLNGVRGVAAIVVVIFHTSNTFSEAALRGWGAPPNNYLIQLPLLRVFTSGSFMVHVFYVLSGFALSYGPLRHAHAGNPERGLAGIPSSIFRRPFRLFLPLLPIIIVQCVLAFYGWAEVHHTAHMEPTVWKQLASGLRVFYVLEWRPFGFDDDVNILIPPMWPQAWTLPCEFRGSIIVFLCCACFIRVRPWLRMMLVSGLAVSILHQATFHWGFWDIYLFLMGMVLADWRHSREEAQKRVAWVDEAMPHDDDDDNRSDATLVEQERSRLTPRRRFGQAWAVVSRWLPTMLAIVVLLFSAWLGGLPQSIEGEPGFGYSDVYRLWGWYVPSSVDPFRYWMSVGAIGLVASLEFLPLVQRVFDSSPIAYLGSISYGAYLAQNIFMFNVGRDLRNWLVIRQVNGDLAAVIAVGANVLVTIWLGDLHWRFVDTKCIAFAKWLAKKVGV